MSDYQGEIKVSLPELDAYLHSGFSMGLAVAEFLHGGVRPDWKKVRDLLREMADGDFTLTCPPDEYAHEVSPEILKLAREGTPGAIRQDRLNAQAILRFLKAAGLENWEFTD